MSDPPATKPAWTRRDSRPPFEPGHTLSLTHGATSRRTWEPVAERLAAELGDDAPWTLRPSFAAAVRAWSAAEAQAHVVDRWLDEVGMLDEAGVPRPATTLSDKLHRRAARARAALGLDPTSFARLLLTFSSVPGDAGEGALAELRAEGGRILAARPPSPAGGRTGGVAGSLGPGGGDAA